MAVERSNDTALYILALATFTGFVGITIIMPLIPLRVLQLGASLQEATFWSGIILGATPIFSASSAPFWGMVADRYGYKMVLQRSLFGFGLLYLPLGIAPEIWQLFVLRALIGLLGGFAAQSMGMAASLAPPDRLPRALGLIQFSQIVGSAVGPALGGLLAQRFGFAGAAGAAAALSIAVGLAVTLWLKNTKPKPRQSAGKQPSLGRVFGLAGFVPILVTLAAIRFTERSTDPLVPILIVRFDPGTATAASVSGLIMSLGTAATALAALLVTRFGGRFPVLWMLLLQLGAGALFTLPFLLVANPWQLAAARIMLGLVTGGALSLGLAFAAQNVPPEVRGVAFGILGSAGSYGAAAGWLGLGALGSIDMRMPFLAIAALYLVAASAAYVAYRQRVAGARVCSGGP